MSLKSASLASLSLATLLAVTACNVPARLEEAQYWQRKNASSALYLRGPKAQQTLHQDIARCTTEINELARLGPVREALPADTQDGQVPPPGSAESRLRSWDSPKRDGVLYAEHFDYTDFESCMDYKGWERVENLPFERAKVARDEYLETIHGYKYKSDHPDLEPAKNADSYSGDPDMTVNK